MKARKRNPKPISARQRFDAQLTKVQRALVFLRDRGVCQWCGQPGAHHLSHVYGKGAHCEIKHEVDNGLAMHWDCHEIHWHGDWHTNMKWFAKHFEKRTARLEKLILERKGERSLGDAYYEKQLRKMEAALETKTAARELELREGRGI